MQIDVDIIHNLEHCVGPVGPVIVAGGLQQYLNNNQEDKATKWRADTNHNVNVNVTTINELPDYILLEILSYMTARELCQLSRVCRHWYWISSDNILWGRRLQKDMRSWKVIKHTTNPHMFLGCQPEWHNKEIYLRCSPEINKVTQFSKQKFPSLGLIYQVFWPKKTPRIAIFGPGLESSTSQIIRKILEDRSKVFNVKGMFPGQFEGLGSGFTIKMAAHTFHLITLYTSSKKERESRHGTERLHVNKLLRQQAHPHQEKQQADESLSIDDEAQYTVTNRVKELCQTMDGFIFVVDSSSDSETVRSGQVELHAMVGEEWMKSDIPLAVLSCTPDTQTAHLPCVDVINLLQLTRFNRPWQIHHCVVEDMSGVPEAIQWLSESTAETGSLSLREILKLGE